MIIVERTGPAAAVQDLGRPGLAHLGVSPSGAADRAAFALANRMLGNPEGAAAIEALGGGLSVRSGSLLWLVVTGAPAPVAVNETPVGSHTVVALHAGDRLTIGSPAIGLRNYLAVRGGIDVAPVLGSRATDSLSGIGPPPLAEGDQLPVGRPTGELPDVDLVAPPPTPDRLRLRPGPRRDWFTDDAWQRLLHGAWTVSQDSDRVGVRLQGPELRRSQPGELPSEGLIRGAVQVPASGQPLIFGADHPVTGGYPVLAVLLEADADRTAQLRPGETVRFALDSTTRADKEDW